MSTTTFHSILPHEPLPAEAKGYILLQGAFQPRAIVVAAVDDGDDTKATSSSTATTPGSVLNEYWTRQGLQECLQTCLGLKGQARLGLPSAAIDVYVLEDEPPFSKARVTYASPREALQIALYCRQHSLSLAQLMSSIDDNDNNNSNNQHAQYSFSAKALQCTRLTQQKRPEPSWARASPPKFRRLLPRHGEDLQALQKERQETRFVFVTNLLAASLSGGNHYNDQDDDNHHDVWTEPWIAVEAIRSVMQNFDTTGHGVEVFAAHKNKVSQYCYIGFRSPADAQTALARLQEQTVTWTWTTTADSNNSPQQAVSGKLFLDYAAVTDRSMKKAKLRDEGQDVPRGEPTRSECTSTTDHVHVPGLLVVPDFVSAAEEEILLALLLGPQAPWAPSQRTPTEGGIVKRRVQHYGYVFDYQTADVLREKSADPTANCPPMPKWTTENDDQENGNQSFFEQRLAQFIQDGRGWPVVAGVTERIRQTTFDVDGNPLCFPELNQITLNHYEPGEGIGSHVDTPSAFGDGLISLSLQSGIVMEFRLPHGDPPQRKLVFLPPRSLVVMTGPARFEWEHMIVTRRTDTIDGKVTPRGVRVSLTFRTALKTDGSPLPLLESDDFPLRWAQDSATPGQNGKLNATTSLVTPECERRHVHEVYDAIARQWHHTRGRRGVLWPGATQFLQRLPPGSVVADVGCGDGKYFPAIWEAGSFVIGTDISRPLLQTAFPDDSDIPEGDLPESRRISDDRRHLRQRPAVAVADCMSLPLRDHSCDAAICIAVLHHLSTHERRVQCLRELARVVRVGGLINVQAWALDQEEGSRRKFATEDVFVPFNAQPKYLDLQSTSVTEDRAAQEVAPDSRSTAQKYSEAFNAQYDDTKGLVVFKRYCHLYRKGELEELVNHVPNLDLLEGGFESGNYFIILQVRSSKHA